MWRSPAGTYPCATGTYACTTHGFTSATDAYACTAHGHSSTYCHSHGIAGRSDRPEPFPAAIPRHGL